MTTGFLLKLFKNTAFIAVSGIIALLLLEIAVRTLNVPPHPLPSLPVGSFRISDNPVLGYEYLPNYKATDAPFDRPHKGFVINRYGFRDKCYSRKKPKEICRIIVLGDSTTAGNGVPMLDDIYPKQLEKKLNKKSGGIRYEVLNMAVGGYHTLQEIETLRSKGLSYDPDLVLITFCTNDFSLNADAGVYEYLHQRNRLALPSSATTIRNFILRHSRLAFIIYHRTGLAKPQGYKWYIKNIMNNQSPVDAGLNMLQTIEQECDFTAIMLILPGFDAPFNKYKHSDIHAKIKQAVKRHPGITLVDLTDHFAAVNNNARVFSYDGLHLNEYGHSVMADILLQPVLDITRRRYPNSQPQ